MATTIVNPAQRAITDYREPDICEQAESSLRGALALCEIIGEATTGENVYGWAPFVIEDLQQAQRTVLNAVRSNIEEMRKDIWRSHARLGDYGEDAKARADAEVQA